MLTNMSRKFKIKIGMVGDCNCREKNEYKEKRKDQDSICGVNVERSSSEYLATLAQCHLCACAGRDESPGGAEAPGI